MSGFQLDRSFSVKPESFRSVDWCGTARSSSRSIVILNEVKNLCVLFEKASNFSYAGFDWTLEASNEKETRPYASFIGHGNYGEP